MTQFYADAILGRKNLHSGTSGKIQQFLLVVLFLLLGHVGNAQIFLDNEPPVPVVAVLPVATGDCEVTVSAPQANDNMAGIVTGTTTDPVYYNIQGTYTITWVYNDGNGNSSTQQQTVQVKDVTGPAFSTTPNIVLNSAADSCGATATFTAPTITDNCSTSDPYYKHTLSTGDQLYDHADQRLETRISQGVPYTFQPTHGQKMAVFLTSGQTDANLYQDITLPIAAPINLSFDLQYYNYQNVFNNNQYLSVEIVNAITNVVLKTVFKTESGDPNELPMTSFSFNISEFAGQTIRLRFTENSTNNFPIDFFLDNVKVTGSTVVNGSFETGDYTGWTFTNNIAAAATTWGIGYAELGGLTLSQTSGPASGSFFPVGTTTITYTASDAAGNESTTSFDIVVTDTQKPTVVTQNITAQLDANGVASITPSMVNNGSFDNCSIPATGYSLDKTSFTCANLGNNTVTLTVTDSNGNFSTGTATVTVQDNIAPTAKAQNITVQLTANGVATITPAQINNGSTDNCGTVSTSLSKTTFDCSNVGANTVTLTVTDGSGNFSTTNATVTVEDTTNPSAVTKDFTLALGTDGKAILIPANVNNGSSDACGIASLVLSKTNFDCSNIGQNSVTLTVTDTNGNSSTSTATVTVVDTVAPTALAKDITVQLGASGNISITAADVDAGSTDACGISSLAVSKSDFNCNDVGANTVTLTVTDVHGNASFTTAVVTVVDKVAPIALAKDLTVQLDASGNASITAVDVDNGSSDACGIASMVLSKADFNCTSVGVNNVVLTVTDVNGNIATAPAKVTVEDNVAPVALAKNITVQLNASGVATISAADVDNGSSDACGIVSRVLSQTNFDCSHVGQNSVTLTVTDKNGNVSTAAAAVTVEDKIAPFANANNITVQLDANGVASIEVEDINNGSSDACGIASITLDKTSFTCANVGSNSVILTVTDVNGNSSTVTANVLVEDNVAPVALVKNITVQLAADGKASITASDVDDGSSDACGIVSAVLSKSDFDCSNVGENAITFTVTDANGNESVATALVTIEDTVAPMVLVKDIVLQLNGLGQGSITTSDVNNGSSDACGIASITLSQTDFNCSHVGPNTVTITVTDVNGNVSRATATVTVEDKVAPDIMARNLTVQLDASGNGSITVADVDNGSSDACGIASMTLSKTTFDCSNVGANDVTFTVTDVNGNAATATVTVTVEDKVVPIAVAKSITVQLDASGNASITAADVDNGSSDACGIASMVLSKTDFNCSNVGQNSIILTVTDNNGNVSQANAVVTIEDTVAPVAIARSITVQLDNNGQVSIAAADVNDGSSDACGIASITLSKTAFDCSNVGANQVTLTVTDGNGNVSTATATVTVEDKVAPVVLTKNITLQLRADGTATITAEDINSGSSDACGIASLSLSKTDFDCSNVGANEVTLTVTDVNGNEASKTATVTVEDNIAPVALAKNLTLQLNAAGTVSITAAEINDGSSDACGIASISLSKTDFDCSNVGQNPVTLTVTDNNGNVSTATATVTVEDKVNPVALAKNITVQLDASGSASITTADVDAGSSDACGIASLALSKTSFDCSNVGQNTVTLTVTDNNGNVSTVTATVTVEDKMAPVILAQDLTIQLDGLGNASFSVADINRGSTDNCGIAFMVLSKSSFDCSNLGPNTVTFSLTDNHGNVSSTTVTITVEDKIAPIVTAPANVTVNVDPGKTTASNVSIGLPTSTDNCAVASVTNNAPQEFPSGTTIVIWTITDSSGNQTTVEQIVYVRPNAVSIAVPALVEVPIRTTFAQVPKPETVAVTFSDGTVEQIAVTWQQGSYNGLINGDYEITGILTVPEDRTNLDNLVATWTVRVMPNLAPTDILLSKTSFQPSIGPDEAIGVFSTVDEDDPINNLPENQHLYELVPGVGSTDNGLFVIDGNNLYLKSNRGLSGRTQFSIRVRTVDPYNNTFEKVFTLTKEGYAVATPNLKIVNAFSPNGDGVNDTWAVPELRFYNEVEIQVFDRSGVQLFQTTNPEQAWDGRNKNGKVLSGPYLYIIQVKDVNYVKRGALTILKN